MATPHVWLITGASSGFGRVQTELVLARGDIVVATLRKPEVLQDLTASYPQDKLLVLKLDVTSQADIDHALAQTKEAFGRLDVVFNNAGYAIFGDAETTPVDAARAMFDVNFWGAVNVSRAAIKFFREVNEPGHGGVLLQNSSITGIYNQIGLALYSASKHAFDGFSEGLAREILPEWNIKICIIGAGSFSTDVMAKAIILPENPVYNREVSVLPTLRSTWIAPEYKYQADPAKFVKAIYLLVEGGRMPLYLPIGQDALAVAKKKVESLGKDISEAEPWSADLCRIE